MALPSPVRTCKSLLRLSLESDEFELTSFAGLASIQSWLLHLGLRDRLRDAFRSYSGGSFSLESLFIVLMLYRMLGFRNLRQAEPYREDPLLLRTAGLHRLPSTGVFGRRFTEDLQPEALANVATVNRRLVLESLGLEMPARLTLDFDGTVLRTRRRAARTAVGYNPTRKGERSYYPLVASVAQSSQVFDVLHRSGNVHDSNGAPGFMESCVNALKTAHVSLPVEVRADSAFYSSEIAATLEGLGCEFAVSVPFMRLDGLRATVMVQEEWNRVNAEMDVFEPEWKPKSWSEGYRLIVVRRLQALQHKGPLQLDLFEPLDFEYTYSAVLTNKATSAASVVEFHAGRGSQEGLLGELKSQLHADAVPFRTQEANALSTWASIFAHNFLRHIQMANGERRKANTWNRSAMWNIRKAGSIRALICRAGLLKAQKLVIAGPDYIRQQVEELLPKLA